MKKIAIIGGGPAGIIAAIRLKKTLMNSVEVSIYEKMDRVGKKLLATGNGKCNLSNTYLDSSLYNNELGKKISSQYSPNDIIRELREIGLITHHDTVGRIYPITDSSNTVLDILLLNLKKYHIYVYTNHPVKKIIRKKDKYQITTDQEICDFDIIVVATGGGASPVFGSNQEGYHLLQPLGIQITDIHPGLVGFKTMPSDVRGLNGLRQKCVLSIFHHEDIIFREQGEVQFKEDGISGIVVMNASRKLLRKTNEYTIELDLLPELLEKDIKEFLCHFDLICILPKMIAQKVKNSSTTIEEMVHLIKHYPIHVIANYGLERAQVTLGGVDSKEVDENLECKKMPNLYIIGELLDVDGPCGGYNLHFAIASAISSSNRIIEKERLC